MLFNSIKRNLLDEIGFLLIGLTSLGIILVEIGALFFISQTMTRELQQESERTTSEFVSILEIPLYILDDDQCIRIGQTLLSSGRISGIQLISSYSNVLLDIPNRDPRSSIKSREGTIYYNNVFLGSYRLDFSDRQIRSVNANLLKVILLAICAMIVITITLLRFIIYPKVNKELAPILESLYRIKEGEYQQRIPESSYPDVNMMITTINSMSEQIYKHRQELLHLNEQLEEKVADRTCALEASLRELQRTQDQLVRTEKLSALGTLSAGIAHELNSPLGAIQASDTIIKNFFIKEIQKFLEDFSSLGKHSQARLIELYQYVKKQISRKQSDRASITLYKKAEKILADEGIDNAASLAESLVEIGLMPGKSISLEWLKYPDAELLVSLISRLAVVMDMAEVIHLATEKAARVVGAIQYYLMPEIAASQTEFKLEERIDNILVLMESLIKQGVIVQKQYTGILLKGSPEKLDQVWLNIIKNALQAMDYQGVLTISTELLEPDRVRVSITDTGKGIATENQAHIFEPFFTTKKDGEGIGLGLDIAKKIVESHGGVIGFSSVPGNTVFYVELPHARLK